MRQRIVNIGAIFIQQPACLTPFISKTNQWMFPTPLLSCDDNQNNDESSTSTSFLTKSMQFHANHAKDLSMAYEARDFQVFRHLLQARKSYLSRFESKAIEEKESIKEYHNLMKNRNCDIIAKSGKLTKTQIKPSSTTSNIDDSKLSVDFCESKTLETTSDLSHKWNEQFKNFVSLIHKSHKDAITDSLPDCKIDYMVCLELKDDIRININNKENSNYDLKNFIIPMKRIFDTKTNDNEDLKQIPDIKSIIRKLFDDIYPIYHANEHDPPYNLPTLLPDGVIRIKKHNGRFINDTFIYILMMRHDLRHIMENTKQESTKSSSSTASYTWMPINTILKLENPKNDSNFWSTLKSILYQFKD